MTTLPRYLLGLDFGSQYIRLAKARVDPENPAAIYPQMIEVDGVSSLENVVLLDEDLAEVKQVGAAVFQSSVAYEQPHRVQRSVLLEQTREDSIVGLAAKGLLQYVYRAFERGHLSGTEPAVWRTVVSVPVDASDSVSDLYLERLRDAGFPNPIACSGAAAALEIAIDAVGAPGMYWVVDCGARHTRVAVCRVDASGFTQVVSNVVGRPGGRDFDQSLVQHFRRALPSEVTNELGAYLELQQFARHFKHEFSNEWNNGTNDYEAFYRGLFVRTSFSMTRTDFLSPAVAGGLVDDFHDLVNRLSQSVSSTETLRGVVLVGGGARWPFVKELARTAGRKVVLSQADVPPEELAVRGLLHHFVKESAASATHSLPGITRTSKPDLGPVPKPLENTVTSLDASIPYISASRAFWTEFLGGLVGVMGLGSFFVLHRVSSGCGSLLGWWAILAATLIALSAVSAAISSMYPLYLMIPIWLSGPLLSAVLARRAAKRANVHLEGSQ
jgi:hypothetical protein